MPTVFVKNDLRAAVEAASGGQQTVLYDSKGFPTVVQIIPKFNIEDVDPTGNLGSGVHPAFIVGGVEKPYIYIGVYQASVVDGNAICAAGKNVAGSITYNRAHEYCRAKGAGWHLMTNWEWAAIALWCIKNGFQPRGNTQYGRSHEQPYEAASREDGETPGLTTGLPRTRGGSGPASWRHNNSFQGIADLVGNVYEWQGGLKIVDGQIFMPNDNDFDMPESQWPAQGVYFDATVGPNGSSVSEGKGAPQLSNGISHFSETPTPMGGGDQRDLSYASIGGATGWQSMGRTAGYNGLSQSIHQRMAQALIASKVENADTEIITAKGGVYARNYGERLPIRGGGWGRGSGAGLGSLDLSCRRSSSASGIGFRPAFIS